MHGQQNAQNCYTSQNYDNLITKTSWPSVGHHHHTPLIMFMYEFLKKKIQNFANYLKRPTEKTKSCHFLHAFTRKPAEFCELLKTA